jgi:hypothetical protein
MLMTVVATSWAAAAVSIAAIAGVALVLTVLVWSIFRTGQTAIRSETVGREPVDDRGARARAEAS